MSCPYCDSPQRVKCPAHTVTHLNMFQVLPYCDSTQRVPGPALTVTHLNMFQVLPVL
ncbi:hypothetical protein DPMN_097350 [Dreissena polymorpha]|uniref:Uncharacterized protein n=1 Tax=Dreissena polymorpha TaxID=45954 RepID=A0A9D4LD48_DREPO|nr:hypothetical protein DPMN_097350 [Dreissena polymorpha]